MKVIIKCILLFTFLLTKTSYRIKDNQDQYINRSYIVLDVLSNKVIEGKEIHLKRSVASVSKIMTAIVAIENGNLDEVYTIKKEDLDTYGSSIYLQEGERISLLDLLYGLMLRSGNDASLAIARIVSGSTKKFVSLMNEKAKDLKMSDSVFNNPSGLDVEEEGNISSSYDLGMLMAYSLKNETFLRIINTKEHKIGDHKWKNKNKLLFSYDKALGGKTGFTYKAKRTLVTAAREGLTTLVVVTLDCGNDFNFHRFLYEKNFQKYETIKILNKGDNYFFDYLVLSDKDIFYTIEKSKRNDYIVQYQISDNMAKIHLVNGKLKENLGDVKIERIVQKQQDNLINRLKKLFE